MLRLGFDFHDGRARHLARGPAGWLLFAPGAALVGLGVAIYVLPQLLIALISSLLIALGSVMLLVAWRMRRG